ncbi:MAG: hypothetical protein ACTHMD_20195 [Flavisolibacter sp.]
MRIIFITLLLLPLLAIAQINRSAKELAGVNIKEYISTKIFKGDVYKPVSYGELQPHKDNTGIVWTMEHKFEISNSQAPVHKTNDVQQVYRFIFYLDKKMKVLKAEDIE